MVMKGCWLLAHYSRRMWMAGSTKRCFRVGDHNGYHRRLNVIIRWRKDTPTWPLDPTVKHRRYNLSLPVWLYSRLRLLFNHRWNRFTTGYCISSSDNWDGDSSICGSVVVSQVMRWAITHHYSTNLWCTSTPCNFWEPRYMYTWLLGEDATEGETQIEPNQPTW
jgi:hypothetical protein